MEIKKYERKWSRKITLLLPSSPKSINKEFDTSFINKGKNKREREKKNGSGNNANVEWDPYYYNGSC